MSLVLQSSSGGSVTIAEPTTASNFTQTLPAATGTVMVSGNQPAFSAYLSGSQTLASATFTKITFDTEEWDTNNNFASSRFTPTVAGYYSVSCAIGSGGTAVRIILDIYKNGSQYKRLADSSALTAIANTNGTTQVYCNGSTDYVEVYAFFATSQLVNTGANTWFNGSLVRTA